MTKFLLNFIATTIATALSMAVSAALYVSLRHFGIIDEMTSTEMHVVAAIAFAIAWFAPFKRKRR